MKDLVLIHLVSEQTMQNLLPIMALRPSKVIQVRSADKRFEKTPSILENACKAAGLENIEFLPTEIIPTDSPDITETSAFFSSLFEKWKHTSLCLNFTGATKLMSIGAYRMAESFKIPSFYTDTQSRRSFVDGKTGRFLEPLPEMQKFLSQITVSIILAAQGKSPGDWRDNTASDKELTFGSIAWKIRSEHAKDFEEIRFGEKIRQFIRSDNNKIPKSLEKLQSLMKVNLLDSMEAPIFDSIRHYLQAAAQAGYLRYGDSGYFIAESSSQKDRLRTHIEKISNILVGSWLELAVLSFLKSSTFHHDSHWSVEATKQGQSQAEYGETDIVAIHTDTSSLEVISCKTSLGGAYGPKALEHLEGLRTRATNLGGNHARATLAVFSYQKPDELKKWGQLLKVNVLIGQDIPRYFNPASSSPHYY